jgi:hypothetical protein
MLRSLGVPLMVWPAPAPRSRRSDARRRPAPGQRGARGPARSTTRSELGLQPVGSLEESVRRLDRVIFLTSEAFDFTPTSRTPTSHAGFDSTEQRADVSWTCRGRRRRPVVLLSLSTTYMQQRTCCSDWSTPSASGLRRWSRQGRDAIAAVGPGPGQRPRGRVRPARSRARSRRPGDHPRGHGTVTCSWPRRAGMVVPISRDQPDNAVRVVHHGVGIKVSKRSSVEVRRRVRRALADDALRSRACEWRSDWPPMSVAEPRSPRSRISQSGLTVPSCGAIERDERQVAQ